MAKVSWKSDGSITAISDMISLLMRSTSTPVTCHDIWCKLPLTRTQVQSQLHYLVKRGVLCIVGRRGNRNLYVKGPNCDTYKSVQQQVNERGNRYRSGNPRTPCKNTEY